MSEMSDKSMQQALPGFDAAISSAGSGAGSTPSTSQAGPPNEASGPVRALANRFRVPADAKARKTNGTSGRNSIVSSASIALGQSLANRLVASTDLNGSMEYRLTWKSWVTRSRRRICALRARQRRTHANAFFGWPTPNAGPQNDSDSTFEQRRETMKAKHGNGNGFGLNLGQAVQLIGWPTPQTTEHQLENKRGNLKLNGAVQLVGWVTPTAQDHSRGDKPSRPHDTGQPLSQQVAMVGWATPIVRDARTPKGAARMPGSLGSEPLTVQIGTITDSSPDATARAESTTAACPLNPAMSRWLQGYPATWDAASPNFAAWLAVQERIASADFEDTATPSRQP
jgi:hypothetical protein